MPFNFLAVGTPVLIDVVAAVILLCFCIYGLKKGFVKLFFKVFGKILALLFAVLLANAVANFLQDKFGVIDSITDWVSGIVTKIFGDNVANRTLAEAIEGNFAEISGFIKKIVEKSASSDIPMDTTLNQIISPAIAHYIAVILSTIGLYIIFRIIFSILGKIIEDAEKIKLVGLTNRILGVALGLIYGLVILDIAIIILEAIPLEFIQNTTMQFGETVLVNILSKVNVFSLILSAMSSGDIIGTIKDATASI